MQYQNKRGQKEPVPMYPKKAGAQLLPLCIYLLDEPFLDKCIKPRIIPLSNIQVIEFYL